MFGPGWEIRVWGRFPFGREPFGGGGIFILPSPKFNSFPGIGLTLETFHQGGLGGVPKVAHWGMVLGFLKGRGSTTLIFGLFG